MSTIKLSLIRKNPLTIPVLIADKWGLFKKYNVDVEIEILEDFKFQNNEDFCNGKVHAMVGDVTFFFYMLEREKKAVITSNLTRTISLVSGNNLPSNLEGITVGVNRTGLFRLFLENDLKNIVPNAKIEWINNTYDRMKALEEGKIDALVAIEPFVTDVVEKGGQVIWSSRCSDKNMVMWAFDEEFYYNNKEEVKRFHIALEEAHSIFNNSSEEEKMKLAIDCAGYNEVMASRLREFTFEEQNNFRKEDFELCQEWMYRNKEITRLYDVNSKMVNIFWNKK